MQINKFDLLNEFVNKTKEGVFTEEKPNMEKDVDYTIYEQNFILEESDIQYSANSILYGLTYIK